MNSYDLASDALRSLNAHLHSKDAASITVSNAGGRHAVAVGAVSAHQVSIDGNVGKKPSSTRS